MLLCCSPLMFFCTRVNYYGRGKAMLTGLPVINYYNLISQWEIKIGKINMVERNTFFFFFFLVNSCVHSEYFCKSKKMCFDCIQDLFVFSFCKRTSK